MIPEPNDPNLFDEPMDTRLLQLERELFSLSPTSPPRGLVARMDCHLSQATAIERRVVTQVIPFRWSRIVVPAAAAVVVVSVLSRMEGPRVSSPSVSAQPGTRQMSPPVASSAAAVEMSSGYLMKEEPFYIVPAGWDAPPHQYWIQSGQAHQYPQPAMRRASLSVPLSFH